MAYFSNSTEGSVFEYQCSICKYGETSCPIAWVQLEYNYEACNNEIARKILDFLISDNGTCAIKKVILFKDNDGYDYLVNRKDFVFEKKEFKVK